MRGFELQDSARLPIEELPGDGRPIVMLHGVLSSAASWRPVATRLAKAGRRVLLPHDRGHGASEAKAVDFSPLAVADDITNWLATEFPDGVHLVGHSRGGTAASWVAVERPDLATSLAVVASPPQATEVFRAHFRKVAERAEGGSLQLRAARYLAQIPDDDFPQHALRRYPGRGLVVEPADDPFYSPVGTMFWRLFLPYADFERIDGGHLFHETEEGADWLAARLLRHFEASEAKL